MPVTAPAHTHRASEHRDRMPHCASRLECLLERRPSIDGSHTMRTAPARHCCGGWLGGHSTLMSSTSKTSVEPGAMGPVPWSP